MKPYKFLIPVGIAASALAGGAAKAKTVPPLSENINTQANSPVNDTGFVQHYVRNGEEHTLLLKVSSEGLLYAQHQSHSSHTSHGSHSSHTSHRSSS